jgi:hypothetical protein
VEAISLLAKINKKIKHLLFLKTELTPISNDSAWDWESEPLILKRVNELLDKSYSGIAIKSIIEEETGKKISLIALKKYTSTVYNNKYIQALEGQK